VLVVEDDRKISDLLLDYLCADGLQCSPAYDGLDALRQFDDRKFALIILDLMLPGLDGIGVCKAVRCFSDVPIMMLTARVDEVDRLLGLDIGADDYVCKPFAPREVVARVRALLRRSEGRVKTNAVPWAIEEGSFRVSWQTKWLPLTRLEFFMLRLLLSRPGRVFSRPQLLDCVHDRPRDISDRAIDTHIKNIRRKIAAIEPGCECITSVYGVGYRFEVPTQ
jgi:two-component system response regulator BaeR